MVLQERPGRTRQTYINGEYCLSEINNTISKENTNAVQLL